MRKDDGTPGERYASGPLGPAADAAPAHGPLVDVEPLLAITSALAGAVGTEEVLVAVVDDLAAAVAASTVGLWVLADDGVTVRLARAWGHHERTHARFGEMRADADVPAAVALRTGEPLWIPSQQDLLQRFPGLRSAVDPTRRYAVACLPLLVEGRPVGTLGATFEDGRGLDEQRRALLSVVARYAGQAVARMRLIRQQREAAEHAAALARENETARMRAELLFGLARAVLAAPRVEDVFEAALSALERALGTTRSAILVADAEGAMRFRAWHGLSDRYRAAVDGHSPWPKDAVDPEPVLVRDVADPAWAAYLPLFRDEGIGSLAFVPIVAGGRLLGKFMVYHDAPREISTAELDVASALANHVGAALVRFSREEELQGSLRFLELLHAIVGHDLRNPLATIRLNAELARRLDGAGALAKPLDRIDRAGAWMARMVDQLLDLARVRGAGGLPVVVQEADLAALARHEVDDLAAGRPATALRLDVRGDGTGCWDADRLKQVLSNLVGNALTHGDPAEPVRVGVDGTAPDHVRLTVRNAGAVPPDVLPRLFEPMVGTRYRDGSRGLGLGMFITKAIVTAHGGTIEVASSPEAGTAITVVLPRRRA